MSSYNFTELELPDTATMRTLGAGTVVWIGYTYVALLEPILVTIEARSATNYDNQRKALDPTNGQYLFYVKGKF